MNLGPMNEWYRLARPPWWRCVDWYAVAEVLKLGCFAAALWLLTRGGH